MKTATLTSVLSLYKNLPRAKCHFLKIAFLNMLTEQAMLTADAYCTRHGSRGRGIDLAKRAGTALVSSLILSPSRLLGTELSVFARFDWRFLQLNSKIIPIFVPNLCSTMLQFAISTVSTLAMEKFARLDLHAMNADRYTVCRAVVEIFFLLSAAAVLTGGHVMSEIVRIRIDLSILNSDRGIVPIDETFEGGFSDAAISTDHYNVMDTFQRYLRVNLLPSGLIYVLFSCIRASVALRWSER